MHVIHRRPVAAALAAATGAVVVSLAPGAAAHAEPAAPAPAPAAVRTLAQGLVSPLSLAVSPNGTRWFSQNFAGQLVRQRPGGPVRPVLRVKDAEIGAVSVRGGVVTFAVSRGENEEGVVRTMPVGGRPRTLADLGAAEERQNPDGRTRYGFTAPLPQRCADQLPRQVRASYRGVDETHPYATATGRDGTTYVADAGANAVWAISPRGAVRGRAMPPVTVRITEEVARRNRLPECTVGRSYRFEAVPTDVEVGSNGGVYVSTLSGGPEQGVASGRVLRMGPGLGDLRVVADGLTSATGLALGKGGDVYVSELFAGRIVRVPAGTRRLVTVVRTPLPGDVEVGRGGLLATTNVLSGLSGEPGDTPDGRVVKVVR